MEKVAVVEGALIGALAGGEKDVHGRKKNRHVGAIRGAATQAGMYGGALAGLGGAKLIHGQAHKLKKAALPLAIITGLGTTTLGGMAGYRVGKKISGKYDREVK